jgi:non-ribosomal peptide synthetase component F
MRALRRHGGDAVPQRWGDQPRPALEYATSVLWPDEAAELATAVDRALVELASDPDGPLARVRTMTNAQRRRLAARQDGPAVDAEHGLWQLFEAAAARHPDRVAVRDADPSRTLTYRMLLRAAEAQSAELAAAGVTAGDCVALAVRRSAQEILAILALLRLGAAYTGIEPGIPDSAVRTMLDSAGVRLVLGDDDRLGPAADRWHGRPVARPRPLAGRRASQHRPGRRVGRRGGSVAGGVRGLHLGLTGTPKRTRVPHRGGPAGARPQYLRAGATDRFVRLAPLAFDASTLEIFAPLVASGTVEVYAHEHVTPDELAEFLRAAGSPGCG